jgi:hypothetical protein
VTLIELLESVPPRIGSAQNDLRWQPERIALTVTVLTAMEVDDSGTIRLLDRKRGASAGSNWSGSAGR